MYQKFLWSCGILVFLSVLPAQAGSSLAPHLSPSDFERISELLKGPFGNRNLEALEIEYQTLVQEQTFSDLLLLYAPENEGKLEITYPSFSSYWGKPGKDRGFGFHVVKKLELPLEGGLTKIITVNEQWPENPADGGLLLPDEIRVKTLVKTGKRRVPGSESLYLFDSIRVAWGPSLEVSLLRQTRYLYDPQRQANGRKPMRVPVSAPISCAGCHRAGNVFAPEFLGPGEEIDPEAIVQPGYFKRALEETHGFREYVRYLEGRPGRSGDFVRQVKEALLSPKEAWRVPGLREAVEKARDGQSFSWLVGDGPGVSLDRQGTYEVQGKLYLDAIEEVFEGKYRWWEPVTVVPSSVYK